jgi:hypothetical protein
MAKHVDAALSDLSRLEWRAALASAALATVRRCSRDFSSTPHLRTDAPVADQIDSDAGVPLL